ncbi:uncharacterized protein LOC102468758 [Tupaia chinensis]|uniref:uncharacterized protein LOC102468758 n=1 Tax=Tupaia chinensis TaxID=246437 RepID=UPI0003C8C999|nr:uncharacterized protein LOC102468758 [Tupaia chinensis]
MVSTKLLPAPPPPPQAPPAMFSFLVPSPATAAGGSAPLPLLRVSGADWRLLLQQLLHCPGDCEGSQCPSARAYWKSLSLPQCRRLFRLPHGAKAAAILVRPSRAARGATQAVAAGAARWPHHLKRQERGREPRSGGGLGRRREAGAELPRWRERRRRDAGAPVTATGSPALPCTYRRASAGRRVRPSRSVFVINSAPGSERGVESASGLCARAGLWARSGSRT